MKNPKKNPEDLVTEHIVVTQEVFSLLWQFRIKWKCKRLSDVILRLIDPNLAWKREMTGDDSL